VSTPRGAPLLGAHTDEVLGEIGYTSEAIADLRESGAIGPDHGQASATDSPVGEVVA